MENQRQPVRIDLTKLVGKRLIIEYDGFREVVLKEVSPSGNFVKLEDPSRGWEKWVISTKLDLVEILEGVEDAIVQEEIETIEA